MVGKNPGHLTDEFIEKLVDSLVRGVHCRIEDSPSPLNFVGSFSAGQFGVPHEPGRAMAGHIEFRHHANAAIARVGDQVADFILRVIKGVGAQFVKFRKFPALRTKALVLREVPVENVHLHGFHAVEIPANDVERNKMAGGIDHQTTPWETRLVLDRECGYGKSVGRHIHELQKCLQPVHRSERRSGPEPGTRRAHVKDVGFILADFLNLFARVIGLNHERAFSGLRGLE